MQDSCVEDTYTGVAFYDSSRSDMHQCLLQRNGVAVTVADCSVVRVMKCKFVDQRQAVLCTIAPPEMARIRILFPISHVGALPGARLWWTSERPAHLRGNHDIVGVFTCKVNVDFDIRKMSNVTVPESSAILIVNVGPSLGVLD
eukprot:131408-Hanusia_phi.AAC.5